jgi:hypothetical protein
MAAHGMPNERIDTLSLEPEHLKNRLATIEA